MYIFQNTHVYLQNHMCILKPTCLFHILLVRSLMHRHDSDSDTASTDEEHTWGGKGIFEYSRKVLPHALIHIVETYLRAGHIAGACAFLAEVAHKKFIKLAARLGRTFGSHARSEVAMLKWILTDEIYVQAARVAKETSETVVNDDSAADIGDGCIHRTYSCPLLPDIMVTSSTDFIQKDDRSLLRNSWEKKMISKKIRVTRRELLSMLCAKLRVADTRANRTDLVRRQF